MFICYSEQKLDSCFMFVVYIEFIVSLCDMLCPLYQLLELILLGNMEYAGVNIEL